MQYIATEETLKKAAKMERKQRKKDTTAIKKYLLQQFPLIARFTVLSTWCALSTVCLGLLLWSIAANVRLSCQCSCQRFSMLE